ncbi:MAG: hypothetical protein MUF78_03025 [Candidatus Edwardsbacteria bacterium]|nr:hypothetical protein [Candidatus Edwardsbacteria bacterium]
MTRTIAAAIIAALLFPAAAAATGARSASLAGAADYLLDDGQVYAWPCRAPQYYRAVIAELGVDGTRISDRSSVAGLYSDQERTLGVIGLAVNRTTGAQAALGDYLDHVYTADTVSVRANVIERLNQRGLGAGLADIPAPAGGVELLYARTFGDWTPGLRIERSAARDDETAAGEAREASSSVTGVTLSASYQPRDALRADASLEYAACSFTSGFTLDASGHSESFTADGARLAAARARAFYSLNEEMTLVPRLSLTNTRMGYAYAQSDTGHGAAGSAAATELALGIGWQYAPTPRYSLIAGLELGYRSAETVDSLIAGDPGDVRTTESTLALPVAHLGLEAQLTRWLTLRLAGSKRIATTEVVSEFSDQSGRTRKCSSDSYQLGCGLGIRTGGLSLDLAVNPELLYSGGKLLSDSGTWPVSQASLIYRY